MNEEGIMRSLFSRGAFVAAAVVVAFASFSAPQAYADACRSECDSEWPCRNDGDGCWGKVTYHRVRHGACMAKCTLKDEASAALDKAKEVVTAVKEKATEVIDKGIELAKEGAQAVENAAVAAANTVVATTKKWIGAGKAA